MAISNISTPEQIKPNAGGYNDKAWLLWSIQELGNWVHLLANRSTHRSVKAKALKDITDAENYHAMMGSHLVDLRQKAEALPE